jgi:hypothetical protein
VSEIVRFLVSANEQILKMAEKVKKSKKSPVSELKDAERLFVQMRDHNSPFMYICEQLASLGAKPQTIENEQD